MELVPILSLIVLVATISTFILSIGAYIYYKIRERKGRTAKAAQPVAIEAELVTPAPLMSQRRFGQTGLRTYSEEQYTEEEPEKEMTRINEPVRARSTASPSVKTDSSQMSAARQYTSDPGITRVSEQGRRKFMRYTSDGYIDPDQDTNSNEEKLRWR